MLLYDASTSVAKVAKLSFGDDSDRTCLVSDGHDCDR